MAIDDAHGHDITFESLDIFRTIWEIYQQPTRRDSDVDDVDERAWRKGVKIIMRIGRYFFVGKMEFPPAC